MKSFDVVSRGSFYDESAKPRKYRSWVELKCPDGHHVHVAFWMKDKDIDFTFPCPECEHDYRVMLDELKPGVE
jgi:hypothetical protein